MKSPWGVTSGLRVSLQPLSKTEPRSLTRYDSSLLDLRFLAAFGGVGMTYVKAGLDTGAQGHLFVWESA